MMNQIFYPDPKTGAPASYVLSAGDEGPLMMLKVLTTRHYADILRVLEQTTCEESTAGVGGMVKWTETPGKGEEPYKIRVHLMRIGDWGLWGVSGELYSSLGKAITQSLPNGIHMIVNHDASLITDSGYIFDDETLTRAPKMSLPGLNSSEMLPGYVKEALLTATAEMWKSAF